jgi:hypothetical protein
VNKVSFIEHEVKSFRLLAQLGLDELGAAGLGVSGIKHFQDHIGHLE